MLSRPTLHRNITMVGMVVVNLHNGGLLSEGVSRCLYGDKVTYR